MCCLLGSYLSVLGDLSSLINVLENLKVSLFGVQSNVSVDRYKVTDDNSWRHFAISTGLKINLN